jgi:folate-binding protein YgfZ
MRTTPVQDLLQNADATFLLYGDDILGAPVVESFGFVETEYAALRKGCALLDLPQRATIRATGSERIDFLNRMITQQLADLKPGDCTDSFWLSRKGRIDADLRIIHTEDATIMDVDLLAAQTAHASLDGYLFAEDCELTLDIDAHHRFALIGPTAPALLAALTGDSALADLPIDRATAATIAGAEVLIDRRDITAEPEFHLLVQTDKARDVYTACIELGAHSGDASKQFRLNPIGWHAYNIARIEGGTPLFNLDFATDTLPHETSLVDKRVSFTKGCYLGQEIVARMQSLGQPKQRICAFKMTESTAPSDNPDQPQLQPQTGDPVTPEGAADASKPIGAITSSTRSPMLSDAAIGFVMLRFDFSDPGATLIAHTPTAPTTITIQNALRFYDPASL